MEMARVNAAGEVLAKKFVDDWRSLNGGTGWLNLGSGFAFGGPSRLESRF